MEPKSEIGDLSEPHGTTQYLRLLAVYLTDTNLGGNSAQILMRLSHRMVLQATKYIINQQEPAHPTHAAERDRPESPSAEVAHHFWLATLNRPS